MIMIIERMPCGLCGRLAPEGHRLCARCGLDLRDALDDIVRIWATVDTEEGLLPRTGDGSPGARGHRSTSPLNLALAAFTDPRTVALGPHDPHDVVGVLHSWAEQVREQTGIGVQHPASLDELRAYKNLTTAVAVLIRMRDWIARQDWAGDLTREVLQIRDALRTATGEARGRARLGRCTTPLTEPDQNGQITCGYLLLAGLEDIAARKPIRCPRCSITWGHLSWPDLAAALRAADPTTTPEGTTA